MSTHGSTRSGPRYRFLTGADLVDLLPMDAAIGAVEAIMRDAAAEAASARGRTIESVSRPGDAADCTFLVMPGIWAARHAAGAKVISFLPDNPAFGRASVQGLAILLDLETGLPRLVADAAALTTIRTGAVVGLASRYLANEDAEVLGIIGTGGLAFDLVAGVMAERRIQRVVAYDKDRRRAEAFVMGLPWRAEVASSADKAAAEADILITATTSREPVVPAAAIGPGTHINAVGNFFAECRELEGATVAACTRYVDDVWNALIEAGELLLAAEEGLIPSGTAGIAGDLPSLVTGLAEGRTSPEQLTLFKTVGTALSDVACLVAAADAAEARDIGTLVEG